MYDFNPPSATPSEKQTEPLEAPLCSGTGQFHSPNNSKNPQDYTTVTLSDIAAMLPNPPSIDKAAAPWVIFSDITVKSTCRTAPERPFLRALGRHRRDRTAITFDDVIERANGCLLDFRPIQQKARLS